MEKKKTIEIGGKTYEMPKIAPDAYMDYIELREDILDTENKNRMFTKAQFVAMIEMIVKLYGGQFTAEELKDPNTGLSVGEIITEFVSVEIAVGGEVDASVGKLRANFTSGK